MRRKCEYMGRYVEGWIYEMKKRAGVREMKLKGGVKCDFRPGIFFFIISQEKKYKLEI